MIRKVYSILRIVAYATSLSGVGLLILSRRMNLEEGHIIILVGFGLVVTGFTAFLFSYGVFLYSKIAK